MDTTAKIMVDGFTKALSSQKHQHFLRLVGLVDITERINSEARMEALRDQIRVARATEDEAGTQEAYIGRHKGLRGLNRDGLA